MFIVIFGILSCLALVSRASRATSVQFIWCERWTSVLLKMASKIQSSNEVTSCALDWKMRGCAPPDHRLLTGLTPESKAPTLEDSGGTKGRALLPGYDSHSLLSSSDADWGGGWRAVGECAHRGMRLSMWMLVGVVLRRLELPL
jgi:hypothetical protein